MEQGPKQATESRQSHDIEVLKSGDCRPESCRVRRSDRVVWTCAESEFEIRFDDDRPMGGKKFESRNRRLERPVAATAPVGQGYKYSVKLLPDGPEVDPEIFIFE